MPGYCNPAHQTCTEEANEPVFDGLDYQDLYGNQYLQDEYADVVFNDGYGECTPENPDGDPYWAGPVDTRTQEEKDLDEYWRKESERLAEIDKPLEAPLIDPIDMIGGGVAGGLLKGTVGAAVWGFLKKAIPVGDILKEPFMPGPE